MKQIEINRNLQDGNYTLDEIFVNLKTVEILLKIFKSQENIEDIFSNTIVVIDSNTQYMHVKNEDASIVIGRNHLKSSEKIILYLDIIHELVHVKQQRLGIDLYDSSYVYVDRPTEIEAYEIAVEEARRLGMNEKEIFDYLYVEWISNDEHKRLASRMGLKV